MSAFEEEEEGAVEWEDVEEDDEEDEDDEEIEEDVEEEEENRVCAGYLLVDFVFLFSIASF
jgi:hypothetical protein